MQTKQVAVNVFDEMMGTSNTLWMTVNSNGEPTLTVARRNAKLLTVAEAAKEADYLQQLFDIRRPLTRRSMVLRERVREMLGSRSESTVLYKVMVVDKDTDHTLNTNAMHDE